ncbi:MAG: HAD hydrolase family protein, partial [Deltaproteobacteria bacterium]|nr:HAD hydrolase family protein [Deltaproteobacteria bacterium]
MGIIIFTDLDGSLLNHDDYTFAGALPSLQRIRQAGIPLIIVTSKTRVEVEQLRGLMGLDDPFIVENGGGIFFPAGYRGFRIRKGQRKSGYTMIRLGISYILIRRFFNTIRHRFNARGFGDLSIDDIARLTGLSHEQAILTKIREFTEPFLMEREEDLPLLTDAATEQGMKITRGGRFYHLIGNGQDKGAAVRIAHEAFHQNTGKAFISIGIGDSE